MQLLAIITMLVDHIGIVFYPDETVWRLIGRIAFPLYAYAIVAGLRHTSNRKRYIRRLAAIAAASQIPYMLAFDLWQVNVVGTFLVAIAALLLLERYTAMPAAVLIVAATAIVLDVLPFSYGSYALLLIVIYRYVTGFPMIAAHLALNIVYGLYNGWMLQHASIVATVLLVLVPSITSRYRTTFVPRAIWLSFYPAHLAILYLIYLWSGSLPGGNGG